MWEERYAGVKNTLSWMTNSPVDGSTNKAGKRVKKSQDAGDNLVQVKLLPDSPTCIRPPREKMGKAGCLRHTEILLLPNTPFNTSLYKNTPVCSEEFLRSKRGLFQGGSREKRVGGRVGEGSFRRLWKSLLVWAAAFQRVNHEDQVRPDRDQGVARLHHLKAHVVEGLDDGHCWGNKNFQRFNWNLK